MNYNGKRAQKHVLRRPREKELKIISKNPYIKKKNLFYYLNTKLLERMSIELNENIDEYSTNLQHRFIQK